MCNTQIEDEIFSLLNGAPNECQSLLKFASSASESLIVHVKENVTYIVAGVCMNEEGQIVLIQEAKRGCRGTWYLPAGRVNRNETLIEACRREFEEEAGLTCDPISLVLVEVISVSWIRFTFLCAVTGGRLKTLAEADEESLQARWFHRQEISEYNSEFPLRGPDILPLVDIAVKYTLARHESVRSHPPVLPCVVDLSNILIRPLVVLTPQTNTGDLHVLVDKRTCGGHVPLLLAPLATPLLEHFLRQFISGVLVEGDGLKVEILGVLAVEHSGRSSQGLDGVCLTLLVSLPGTAECQQINSTSAERFEWHELGEALTAQVSDRLLANGTVQLHTR